MDSANGQIVDTTTFCAGFPEVPGTEISRDNVLHTLETICEGETQLLVLESPEGHDGTGKTVLLSQFARTHLNNCASIFIRPTSWFAYDPEIIFRDLCSQIKWILDRESFSADYAVDDALLKTLVYRLQGHMKACHKLMYFIVDGICDIPSDRLEIRDVILSHLPFGLPRFRFLMTGRGHAIANLQLPKLIRKTYTLAGFSLDETISYFGDNVSRQFSAEVFKVSHGIPVYFAAIRRLLESGTTVEELLDRLPSTMPELFAMEWKQTERTDDTTLELLALLSHDRNKHTIRDLATIFQTNESAIRVALSCFTFLTIPEFDSGEVEFVSDTYRKFAAQSLAKLRDPVKELVIEALLRDPEGEKALQLLPSYLDEMGKGETLLSYLSPEHLARMLEKSQLLTPVQQKARLGVDTALRLHRDADLLCLSLKASAICSTDAFSASRAEVEARLALGDFTSCIALARIIHEGTESGSLGGVCALRMVVAA